MRHKFLVLIILLLLKHFCHVRLQFNDDDCDGFHGFHGFHDENDDQNDDQNVLVAVESGDDALLRKFLTMSTELDKDFSK